MVRINDDKKCPTCELPLIRFSTTPRSGDEGSNIAYRCSWCNLIIRKR